MLDTTRWRSCHHPSSFESRPGSEARLLHQIENHRLRKIPLDGVRVIIAALLKVTAVLKPDGSIKSKTTICAMVKPTSL